MKKIVLLTLICLFSVNVVCFAAVSGSKSRTSSPSPKPPTTQTAPNSSSGYKPSAPANSYSSQAPAAKQTAPAAAQQPASGGFMRNLAMFGGGMLVGSMLGGMFGFGNSGMFATLTGLLFNIILLAGVFMAGRYLWNKFKKSKEAKNNFNIP